MEDSEQLPETQLPAYSPTVHSSSSMDPNQGMCCAFRKIAGYARRTESYLELMNQPPKYRFLCFVALCQIPDKSLGSEARYRCPVLGCGLQFDREHSVELLNHVSGCSRLALGRYYCPYCYRPEVFADPETFPHGLKHSRRHFLKNAFDAIFRLGSKKLRKPVHHSRKVDSFKEARSSKKRRYVEEPHIPELEGGEFVPASGRVELEESRGNQSLSVKRSSYHSAGAVELSGSPFWPSELDAGFPEVAPSATVEPSAVELSSNRYSYPSVTQTSTGGEATPDYSLSPVSPATSSERWFSSKDFDSPISPIGINSSAPWSIDSVERIIQSTPRLHAPSPTPSYQFDTTQGPHSATNGMEGWQPQIRPDIRIDTKCASSRPVQTSSPASSGVGIPIRQPIEHRSPLKKVPSPLQIEAEERSPTKLVGEIRGLFNSLFKVSVHKMSQPPISPAAVALFDQFPSAAGLFSEAFFGLDKVVRGILPTTLFEVLGLAHLVYASAFACQQEDVEDLLPEIFKDLKNWSQAIIKDDDRKIYLQLVQQIFSIDGEENSSPYGDPQWTYKGRYSGASHSPLGMPPPPPPPSFWPMDTGSGEQLAALQREFMDEDKLLGSFQKGVAIRLCLEYLSSRFPPIA